MEELGALDDSPNIASYGMGSSLGTALLGPGDSLIREPAAACSLFDIAFWYLILSLSSAAVAKGLWAIVGEIGGRDEVGEPLFPFSTLERDERLVDFEASGSPMGLNEFKGGVDTRSEYNDSGRSGALYPSTSGAGRGGAYSGGATKGISLFDDIPRPIRSSEAPDAS